MTIDEIIENEKEIADMLYDQQRSHSAYYHEQLAEWLGELKDYRDKNKMVVRIDTENVDSVKDKIDELSKYAEIQYNKAIDDFAKRLIEELSHTTLVKDGYYLANIIKPLAEQLKAGVEDENT